MKIIADKDGKQIITALCDIALKQGGLGNLNAVEAVLKSIQDESTIMPECVPVNENKEEKKK